MFKKNNHGKLTLPCSVFSAISFGFRFVTCGPSNNHCFRLSPQEGPTSLPLPPYFSEVFFTWEPKNQEPWLPPSSLHSGGGLGQVCVSLCMGVGGRAATADPPSGFSLGFASCLCLLLAHTTLHGEAAMLCVGQGKALMAPSSLGSFHPPRTPTSQGSALNPGLSQSSDGIPPS